MLRFFPQNVIFSQFRRLSSSKLPERLSEKLLQGPKNRKSFPKAPKSLSLARNLAQADVSLPEFILQIQPYIANKTETTFVEDGDLEGKGFFVIHILQTRRVKSLIFVQNSSSSNNHNIVNLGFCEKIDNF